MSNGSLVVSLKMSTMFRLTKSARIMSPTPSCYLYGFPGSTNTDRVRLTLAEAGISDYKFVVVDLRKGEQKVSRVAPVFLSGDDARLLCAQVD